MTNVLSVVDARKSFCAVTALDGASFDLPEGELLALLGRDGARHGPVVGDGVKRLRPSEARSRRARARAGGPHAR